MKRYRILLPAVLFLSCDSSFDPADANKVARAYAEKLVAESAYPADSARADRAADSVARAHGFDGEADLLDELKNATLEPDALRTIMDSTQRHLEAMQQKDSL